MPDDATDILVAHVLDDDGFRACVLAQARDEMIIFGGEKIDPEHLGRGLRARIKAWCSAGFVSSDGIGWTLLDETLMQVGGGPSPEKLAALAEAVPMFSKVDPLDLGLRVLEELG